MVFLSECFLTNFLSLLNICCVYILFCISEPYVTEDELKLMLRGAELSGAIEEEEQVIVLAFIECIIFVILFCFDIIMTMHCTC